MAGRWAAVLPVLMFGHNKIRGQVADQTPELESLMKIRTRTGTPALLRLMEFSWIALF